MKKKPKNFIKVWIIFLIAIILADIFHHVTGWSKLEPITPIPLNDALVVVLFTCKSWVENFIISGVMAYLFLLKPKHCGSVSKNNSGS